MNNNNNLETELVVVSKKFDENSLTSQVDNKDYKIVKDVYNYQSKSKLDELPLWAKILIACVLILIAIGAIVGGAFAINAVSNLVPQEPVNKIFETIVVI
ncbi:hypothetical protein [Mycoplasmoides pirum]|uniref:hypothetical protein n=1 Tax=Mycoplasmoides pirum TaxID=2122 RepID=UPI000695EFAD|nr:hypothetical protein [Mycoplasmoides pirum]